MRRLFLCALAFSAPLFGADAANDLLLQQRAADNTGTQPVRVSPDSNSLLGFDAGKRASKVSIGPGLRLLGGELRSTGDGTGDMLKEANLSDLTDVVEARENLGLGNVDNTSDANKPVSTAQAAAIAAVQTASQPRSAELTTLSSAADTGYQVRTGAGTSARRTFVPGSGIAITNTDGVSGNTTISIASSPTLVTPNIGAATGTSLTLTSGGTFGADVVRSGAQGTERGFRIATGGSLRWYLYGTNSAEAGSNAGTDLVVTRYSDAGTSLGNALVLSRATGSATFAGRVNTTINTGGDGWVSTLSNVGGNGIVELVGTIAGPTSKAVQFHANGAGVFRIYNNATPGTLGTQALQIDAAQNTTFSGNVAMQPAGILYTNNVYHYTGGATPLVLGWTGSAPVLSLLASGNATLAGNLTMAGSLTVGTGLTLTAGNLLLGTNTATLQSKTSGGSTVNLLALTADANNITRFISGVDAGGFQWTNQAQNTTWASLSATGFIVPTGVINTGAPSASLKLRGGDLGTGTTAVVVQDSSGNTTNTSIRGDGAIILKGTSAVTGIRTNTLAIDLGNFANGATLDFSINVPGASVGDSVHLGAPSTLAAGVTFCGWVSSANTVAIRLYNASGGNVDMASMTWRATVMSF